MYILVFLGFIMSGVWLWFESKWGDDVIVGVIDLGIWFCYKSFSDFVLGLVFVKWKGGCDLGLGFNVSVDCNLKIIGVCYFIKGYEVIVGCLNDMMDLMLLVDVNGYGIYCVFIVVGCVMDGVGFVVVNNVVNGMVRGMVFWVRIVVYKVMWGGDGDGVDFDIF